MILQQGEEDDDNTHYYGSALNPGSLHKGGA